MKKYDSVEILDEAIQEWLEEEKEFLEEILESTPETRKLWTTDHWVYSLYHMAGLIYEKDCPINDFTPEQWREIIINGCGFEPQFCPCPEAVLPLLSKDDFLTYGSHSMCTLLVLEGDWLAHLLPLEDIEQEDFDNVLISSPDDFKSEEDVFKFVGARFPGNKIPDHLTWPHKGESGKK